MAQVKKHKVTNRLSTLIFESGGIGAREALKRADAAIDALRPLCLEDLDDVLGALDRHFGRLTTGHSPDDSKKVYLFSSQIIDCAIALPGSSIEQAARALCEFVDMADQRGVQDWAAVGVYIDSIKLLRAAGTAMSRAQRDAVLGGLSQLARKRFGDTATALS